MNPFLNIMVAMDAKNGIGINNTLPWSLKDDERWFLTISTMTKVPSKRNVIIVGRLTYESFCKYLSKYFVHWHFIIITLHPSESVPATRAESHVDVAASFEKAVLRAHALVCGSENCIESVFVLGGVRPYEEAMASGLVRRIYLTRIFAEYPCDTHWSSLDLKQYQKIRRSSDEVLAELDDRIVEENGVTYQFQVYELVEEQQNSEKS